MRWQSLILVALCLVGTVASHEALSQPKAVTAAQPAPAQSKPPGLDVRGVDAKAFVKKLGGSLTATKKFLDFTSKKLSDEAKAAARAAVMAEIDSILAKGDAINDNDKKLLKQKRDTLAATESAIDAIKTQLQAQGLADLVANVNSSLDEIKKINSKSLKIAIVSAEYGDLRYKIGKITKSNRYCDFKDKAINDCQNKEHCTLTTTAVCNTDPAPQTTAKKIRVKYQCIGPDMKPVLLNGAKDRTAESPLNASTLLVACLMPDGDFPEG